MHEMKNRLGLKPIRLALTDILPGRQFDEAPESSRRYRLVFASIQDVGVIEPLVVSANKDDGGKYRLLDGHLRWHALISLGETTADCLLSTGTQAPTGQGSI